MNKLNNIYEKFITKDMRTFARILNLTEKMEVSPYDLRDYVINNAIDKKFIGSGIGENARSEKIRKIMLNTPECPECGQKMALGTLNTGGHDNVGGNWKSQWWCVDCDESIWNEKSKIEIMDELAK